MAGAETVHAELAYATAARQWLIAMDVAPMTSVQALIEQSGILGRCPEIDLTRNPVGRFGEIVRLTDPVRDGDRIEIYRTLQADPKAARRARAGLSRAGHRRRG